MQSPSWIVWNLFLSAVPVGLAHLWVYCVNRWSLRGSSRKQRIHWLAFTPLIVGWVAFLPNTCYLLTEWRHFLFDSHFVEVRDAVDTDRSLMLRVARQGLFFLCYSGFGVLCLLYAIRPVEQLCRRAKVHKALWMTPLFLLTSLGVYLGLIIRLNSWDLLTRPLGVWATVESALSNGLLLQTIVIFAALLWICYEISNIWADGLAERLRKRRLL